MEFYYLRFYLFSIYYSAKSLYFSVDSVDIIAQPNATQGYTGIFFSVDKCRKCATPQAYTGYIAFGAFCNLLSIKKQIK